MPNLFAYFMLLIWPIVMIVLFRKLPVEKALIWSLLGGYLILPQGTAFDFPMLPALDKTTIPNIMALIICFYKIKLRESIVRYSIVSKILIIMIFLSPIFTVFNNFDPIIERYRFSPGLKVYDIFSYLLITLINTIPIFLGYSILKNPADHKILMNAFIIAALIYSFLILIEIRLSPQLHVWIYGFFPHDFTQQIRFGGFRAVVFLGHGLLVSFFVFLSLICALIMYRFGESGSRNKYLFAYIYLLIILILNKSVGVLIYAALISPAIILSGQRTQIKLATLIALIVLTYPILRGTDSIPVDGILAQAEKIHPERAESLEYRFRNEEMLLDRANQRPAFGWGGWGRNHVYDPDTGRVSTVTDGVWIIIVGYYGWFGYIAMFGLLTLPIFALRWNLHTVRLRGLSPVAGGGALVLAVNLFDLLPNSPLTPLTWLMAGMLLGFINSVKKDLIVMRGPEPQDPVTLQDSVFARKSDYKLSYTRKPIGADKRP